MPIPFQKIAASLQLSENAVRKTIALLEEGATIPFIARYRKEMTGSLDEVQIRDIRDAMELSIELEKRREAILKSLKELDKLSPDLERAVRAAETLAKLEDLYLPYKPKRKTRAMAAREKGLQELANALFQQRNLSPEDLAEKFLDEEKGVLSLDIALAGARDILAEEMMEKAEAREDARQLFARKTQVKSKVSKGKQEAGIKYKDYFDWSESLAQAPSHRVLALFRGENEGVLTLALEGPDNDVLDRLERRFLTGRNACADQVELAIQDGYKRLLQPAMETEMRAEAKKRADEEAIRVFAENVRQLLLAAPLGQKRILSLDPGFRTGCKLVYLDEQGNLIENTTIYPHTGPGQAQEAEQTLRSWVKKYQIEAIAIGNGTAGRESESFVKNLRLDGISIIMVNESGASIYSASEVAREEFPDKDITVRGAVSIGRRLMDPLAELVKIDPKSIGVGQYQHDVDQKKLQASLDDTVISCVNSVGVELNTASKQILSYISGLGPQLAQNIIDYRQKNGPFLRRSDLKKVPRLGEKAFEQAAAFLRIRKASNPLDASAVHPERYPIVEQMAKDLQCKVADLLQNEALRKQIQISRYVSTEVGIPTLTDIVQELAKPGRDPREQFEAFEFTEGVNSIKDLRVGMKLAGIVTNITNFGAFVDIGVHQDGLVHVSQLADKFVKDPNEVVKVQQKVLVTVTEVDEARKRIALSMKAR
ncbi:RNA-binding transcriptional accessory protein [Aquirufa nivalisilvae]|uniref:Tex family protein n=1 Tax=Aquirufa nivalisilvae TaxID=2516557 RepID=UPI0022A958E4|nr:Tex family protein [Aquirufa nivalisilvae]MCZ2482009.1 RNA-binding transcriptional accessory protein [Aquirufa nivalisilvae]